MPKPTADLTGETFSDWTVIRFFDRVRRNSRWLCRCVCSMERVVYGYNLLNGVSKSCGHRPSGYRHGMCETPTYAIWQGMKQRCLNPNYKFYHHYGGRGIKICIGWNEFDNFFTDMGECPLNFEIDRKDNNGHYSCGHCPECLANRWPANCRWATRAEQVRNTRRNRFITFNNQTLCYEDWAKTIGISPQSLSKRLRKWPLERALTEKKNSSS